MTEDELDLLASAYLDGEATSEEVAMVEADPELLARVEALRSVSEQLGATVPAPPGALKEQQLAAALAAFDPMAGTAAPAAVDNVTSIGSRQSNRSREQSNRSREQSNRSKKDRNRSKKDRNRSETAGTRSIPQWLPAAAGLLLLGGGVIWLAGQTGSDDADTAALDTSADSAESAGEDAADDAGEASSAAADGDAEALAAESAAVEEDAAEEAEEEAMEDADQSTDDAADEGGTDGEGSERSTTAPAPTTTGGFFPEEPVLFFDSLPEPDDLLGEPPEFRFDLSTSRCGADLPVEAGAEVVGYLPVEIEAEPAELLLVVDGAGAESILIVDQGCNQVAP